MSKENCLLCQIIDGKVPSKKIYEDDKVIAILDINGANPGHSFVIPKNHYPIMEQIPDEEIENLFNVANKVSSAIFENLNVQGTNIFITNGVPAGQTVAHFMIHVIPRKENDGISLTWEPKQLSEEEMSTIELKIKEQAGSIGISEGNQNKKSYSDIPESAPDISGDESFDDKDPLSSHLNRIP